MLDPDRELVHADRVPAADPERHQLVDRAVGVHDEVRARARVLAQVRRVRRERVPRSLPRRAGRVVLDDRDGCVEPPAPRPVVPLRVGGHLAAAAVAVRDRLPHDRRPQRRDVGFERLGRGDRRRRAVRAGPPAGRAPGRDRAAASATRSGPARRLTRRRRRAAAATVRSLPSSASDSGSGGDTFDPVTAARTGCHPFVRLRPAEAASASSASWICSVSHRSRASSATAASLRYPSGAFAIRSAAFSLGATSSVKRNRSSTGASASVFIRSRTIGIARRSSVRVHGEPLLGEEVHAAGGELVVVELLDVVVVHPLELLRVEDGRVVRDVRRDRKPRRARRARGTSCGRPSPTRGARGS